MEDKINDIKKCPYCGEDIHVNAVKCPYCRTWLNETPDKHVPINPISSSSPTNSSLNGLEQFLDRLAERVSNFKLLKWLCFIAMIFALYDWISLSVDVDSYYRSSFLNAIVWIESNLHWLIALLEGVVEIGILLALRKILIKYGIKSWISYCIIAAAAFYIFDAISTDSPISMIFVLASTLLSLEYGYKMSRSQITQIKNVGYSVIALWVITIVFLLLSNNFDLSTLKWIRIAPLIAQIEMYKLIYKLFKKEYSENL